MTRGRPEYDVLDHTADAGVVVRALDEKTLFERAAAAMFDLMVDVDRVAADLGRGAIEREIEVDAVDREALLVAWLGELLSVAMAGGYVFGEFDVRRLEETSLSATVRGCPLDPHRHGFRTELKAVTYHALSITRNDRVWTARVIFDV